MIEENKVQLKISSIKNVPLQTYNDDFSFIVNGEEFKTSRLVSDLLSPKICQIHTNDPTFDHFIIDTQSKGNFSRILQLNNFNDLTISDDELEFMIEVIEILGTESFSVTSAGRDQKLTIDNVLKYLKKHEKHENFYLNSFLEEIEYVSSHFFEICEESEEEMKSLRETTLNKILRSRNLHLKDEDQLLNFLNTLYGIDTNNSSLYETVIFTNVTSECMKKFVDTIELKDVNESTWRSLALRLCSEIKNKDEKKDDEKRYEKSIKILPNKEGRELNGIISYLNNKTGSNIHDNGTIEVTSNITSSNYLPKNVVDFNNDNCYSTGSRDTNAWICFDFKNREIEISSYTIKSASTPGHAKNWVIEVSNDGSNWTKIHEVTDCSELNGNSNIKTFEVQRKQKCRYCRFRHNGEYWDMPGYNFRIGCIEFYGHLSEL